MPARFIYFGVCEYARCLPFSGVRLRVLGFLWTLAYSTRWQPRNISFFQLREYELAQDFNGKHPEHTEYEVIKMAELPTDEKENFVDDDQREKVGELFYCVRMDLQPPGI